MRSCYDLDTLPMKAIIAEKPSVARDIASVLGATTQHNGYLSGNGYLVSWAIGHLVGLGNPDSYDASLKQWRFASLPIIPEPFKLMMIGSGGAQNQLSVLKTIVSIIFVS